ncbi:hypothetical protein MNV49_001005 [Pseudohyphozyma bogoriensis]|nr:hypothetical protein MNV49_001005 [Pseudohyphozyma bogoriensis]
MSIINISDITVLENHAKFTDPYRFKITFECMAPLEDGEPSLRALVALQSWAHLEWKLVYVGSAESESYDQELDTCMVGPVPVGVNSFEFEAAAPLPSRIPPSDLIGVTVILLTCAYADQEFVRIGYYVNTEYGDPDLKATYDASLVEGSNVTPPDPTRHVGSLVRSVLVEKPRVTRFNIKWDSHPSTATDGSLSAPQSTDSSTIPPPFSIDI